MSQHGCPNTVVWRVSVGLVLKDRSSGWRLRGELCVSLAVLALLGGRLDKGGCE